MDIMQQLVVAWRVFAKAPKKDQDLYTVLHEVGSAVKNSRRVETDSDWSDEMLVLADYLEQYLKSVRK